MIKIGSRVKIKNDLEMLNRIYRKNHEFTIISSSERGWDIQDDNGNVIAFVGVGRDITKRKLAENRIIESLREKELLLREVQRGTKRHRGHRRSDVC